MASPFNPATVPGSGSGGGPTVLQETIVGVGGVASVSFQSIPQTYREIWISSYVRSNGAAGFLDARFNNDATAVYFNSGAGAATNQGHAGNATVSTANQGYSSFARVLQYANTNWNTNLVVYYGGHNGGGFNFAAALDGFLYTPAGAITRIDLFVEGGPNIGQNSVITFYGVN